MGRISVIAECGINFNGDMALAAEMIRTAKKCGADVAKFQIYKPDRLLDKDHPVLKPHWDTILKTELTRDNVKFLKQTCDTEGIEFLASVFHPDRVPWTEEIGMKRYKIASRSIYNEKLATAIANTDKPVLLSYGYFLPGKAPAILKLNYTHTWFRTKLLYCVSQYPTPFTEVQFYKKARGSYTSRSSIFTCHAHAYDGFSDHTIGITASVVAMSLGATIIEKHFTLNQSLPGPDQTCSIEPDELKQLCEMRDEIEVILR